MSHHHAPHSPDSQGHSHESDHGHPDTSRPGYHHDHRHSHHHGHHHPSPSSYTRAFTVGLVLNAGFVLVEFGFGLKAGSIALIADAGHNLSDVMGLILAWGAWLLARRRPTADKTYGWRKSSILAACLNAGFLLIVTGGIAWEAVGRLLHPSPVEGITLIWVAAIGIAINTLTALMFLAGRQTDLNIRAAFMHMAADALVSLGVVLAGIVLLFTQWVWLDPAFSLVISGVIIAGTWSLLAESFHMAVDGVPSGIDGQAVRLYLMERPGVTQVHDLHIWGMSTTETALTAHLVIPQAPVGDGFLAQVCQDLRDHFGIDHTTLQIETGDPRYPCLLEPIEHV